jgi:glycosyltransferase involved in cell wall biosynthesis
MNVVWFSEIKWNYLKTRKQQIIGRRPPDVQLVFLEPYARSSRNVYRVRREGGVVCATIPFLKAAPYFPWRTVLDRGSARASVDFFARKRIEHVLGRLRFKPSETGFIISNIYAANIVSRLHKKFLVYDCNDDHSSFPGMRSWTTAYFHKTAREADAVFASSEALFDKVAGVRGADHGCYYLGNGVDYEHYQRPFSAKDDTEPAPGGVRTAEKPRLGYMGALAPWLDFEALADLARRRPQWEIVLVGPVLLGVEDRVKKLTSLPNVFHLPAVSYDKLPGVLAQFTVGLIPFRYNELTRGVNPNKMYEYLASGLPVVTTRFSTEVAKYPDVVKAVDPGDAFVAACDEFMNVLSSRAEGAGFAESARAVARENDWNVIAAAFWKRIGELSDRLRTG